MPKLLGEISCIFSPNENYSNHRIPGICVSRAGTLLVYVEARRSKSDWAEMDIVLKRSTDGGKTFGDAIFLAHGDKNHPTVNNPTMASGDDGRLHFLFCRDYTLDGGGVFYTFSDDDGLTWSEARDISQSLRPEYHNCLAIGPGHGIETSTGTLIFPAWLVPDEYGAAIKSHTPSVLTTIYSKDNGSTWQMGEIIKATKEVRTPNETVAAELSDGRIMLNIRSVAPYRAYSVSENGYSGWTEPKQDKNLSDPGCFGSIISVEGRSRLFFVNCESQSARENLVLKSSTDGGKSWSERLVIDPSGAGYADIAADEDNRLLYILYEKDFGVTEHLAVVKY